MSKRFYADVTQSPQPYAEKYQTVYPVRMPSTHKVTFTKKKPSVKSGSGGVRKNQSFAAKVKKVMMKAAEKKQVDSQLGFTAFGSAATSNHLIVNLLPNAATLDIAQGSAVNNRSGNRVRIKKVTFRGQIVPHPYDATHNTLPEPQNVKFWFTSNKGDPADPATPTVGPWFRASATTSSLTGSVTDPYRQMDHESIRVYKEVLYKVGFSKFGASGDTGIVAAEGYYANNDCVGIQRFSFDVTKFCPKEIVWDDTTVAPLSRQLSCVIQATNAMSGTAMGATSNKTCMIEYQIHIEYTDV